MKITNLPLNILKEITEILNRGNSAEIKKEKENVVVVEILRQVKNKTPLIGKVDTAP